MVSWDKVVAEIHCLAIVIIQDRVAHNLVVGYTSLEADLWVDSIASNFAVVATGCITLVVACIVPPYLMFSLNCKTYLD